MVTPRKPLLTLRILKVLESCFNAAEAGGFDGDTSDVNTSDAEAARVWLDDCRDYMDRAK